MQLGTVTKIIEDRGFGFIRPDHGETGDVFFHCKSLRQMPFDSTLRERRVQFDLEDSPKGPRATNVCPAL